MEATFHCYKGCTRVVGLARRRAFEVLVLVPGSFNPFTNPRVINSKFPLQPNQKYYTISYEELGFS